jgi:hypothetical protein
MKCPTHPFEILVLNIHLFESDDSRNSPYKYWNYYISDVKQIWESAAIWIGEWATVCSWACYVGVTHDTILHNK